MTRGVVTVAFAGCVQLSYPEEFTRSWLEFEAPELNKVRPSPTKSGFHRFRNMFAGGAATISRWGTVCNPQLVGHTWWCMYAQCFHP